MPCTIKALPIFGDGVVVSVTVRAGSREATHITTVSGTLTFNTGFEDMLAYESAKNAKKSIRTIAWKAAREALPDADDATVRMTMRATAYGGDVIMPTAEERKAAEQRKQAIRFQYELWFSVLEVIHALRYWKDRFGNAVLMFWLKMEPK